MTKVHHSSSSTSLATQLKAIEKKALDELKAQQAKADANINQLEQLEPEMKSQLEALKQKVDQKFSVERTALEAKFNEELKLLGGLDGGGKTAAPPKAKPPTPMQKAVATLKKHFGELDTEAGLGKKDGLVSNLDLAAALKDPKASKEVKDAAQYLLTHGKDFDALDTAAHGGKTDDKVSLSDVNAETRKLAKPAPKAHGSSTGKTGGTKKGGKKKPSHPAAASGGVNKSKLPSNYRKYADEISAAAKKYHLPPAYIAAVMDRETGGRNILGDGGHGHGLMQIDDRSHGSWLRSHHNGLDPKSNIDYGASILAANLKAAHQHGLTGDKALKFAASAYNAGLGGAEAGLRSGNSDARTTGHNYGSDVLKRMKRFEPGFSGGAKATGGGKTSGGKKSGHTGKTTHEPKPKGQAALRKKIVDMAMSQVGTRESGNNGGGARKYQQYFHRGQEAWCADFVSWIYSHSGEKMNFSYCPTLEQHLKATHKWKGKHNPQPGDVVLFDWNHDGTPDHVGIVKKALGNGMVETVEGNTSNPNGSGEGVFVKRRAMSDIVGFGNP